MKTTKFISRLNRYLAGRSDRREQQLVDEWYDSFPEHTDIAPLHSKGKKERLFAMIIAGIDQPGHEVAVRRLHQHPLWKVAAVLLLISATALFWWRSRVEQQNYKAQYVIINTDNKGIKKISLPDSSIVWLNASGKIRFQRSFGDTSRTVYLDEGEAFFEVRKNPKKPFYVYTPTIHTRVLGTSFNIKSYRALNLVRVTVSTGKVKIGYNMQDYGLFTAGQQLTYNLITGKAERKYIDDNQAEGWRTGKVRLMQVGFNELALTLSNLYHVNLKAANPAINKLKYTLTIESSQSLTEVLTIINAIHETKTRRANNDITLYK